MGHVPPLVLHKRKTVELFRYEPSLASGPIKPNPWIDPEVKAVPSFLYLLN